MANEADIRFDSKARPHSLFISKSKFLWGRQCLKLIWHAYNAKHLIPEADAHRQSIFDQGHEVGELARQLYPGGIAVGKDVRDFEEILTRSKAALEQRRPLYEAAFAFKDGYARADILNPAARDGWDVIEVKSTTEVKDVHLKDLAFQAFVYKGAGLNIRKCFVCHINRDYVRQGAIHPKKFFVQKDVTDSVLKLAGEIDPQLAEMFRVTRLKDHPDIKIGPHCDDPYPCPLHDRCWSFLPPASVLTLYRSRKKGFNLLMDGITGIKDIPDSFPLTENQEIQRRAALSGKPHISKAAIKAFLRQLKHPVSFLDFETFGTAIPLFDQTRPYEQVPFQFSLHVVTSPGRLPGHHKFLADGRADPRREFPQRLRDSLPDAGSVVVYNAQFELGRLQECCKLQPDFQPWLTEVQARIVDLLKPFRAFRYYAAGQNGSASMKAVLPALTGRGYADLEIQEGGQASLEYWRVHFRDVPEAERRKVRAQLERYCGLDTEGMIWIVDALWQLAG